MHREDEHFRGQMMRFNSTADLQPVHHRHRIIDDRHIRLQLQGQRNGVPAIDRFPAHDPVGASFDDRAETGPHDFMVVRNQDLLHSDVPVGWNHWPGTIGDRNATARLTHRTGWFAWR